MDAQDHSPFEIVVDVFERGSSIPDALHALGACVSVQPLAAGDHAIAGGIVVERKTVLDLHGSLGRGRLFAQIGRMRDSSAFPYLLVEGVDLDRGPRHPNAIRGALLAVADLGVATLRSRDPDDSASWIHRLALRQQRRAEPWRRAERAQGVPAVPSAVGVLAAVPGISAGTARQLLERFGSIRALLETGPAGWADVPGVGSVRAAALEAALLGASASRAAESKDPRRSRVPAGGVNRV